MSESESVYWRKNPFPGTSHCARSFDWRIAYSYIVYLSRETGGEFMAHVDKRYGMLTTVSMHVEALIFQSILILFILYSYCSVLMLFVVFKRAEI